MTRLALSACIVVGWLIAAAPVGAETHDLHVYGYCSPTSNLCGFGSQAAWNLRVLNAVQEMNEIWKPTGKSFRPILHAIATSNPNYYGVTGCNSADSRNPYVCENLTTPCQDDDDCTGILGGTCNVKTVCENLTQSCNQFCQDLLTECDSNSDCNGIGDEKCRYSNLCGGIGDGHCLTVNQQQRVRWRKEVGILHPGAVSLMLTEGSNVCCSNIPSSDDANWAFFGIFCDPARSDFDTGSIWAHEMGHHFCLSHTFSRKDFADTMPNQPDHDGDFGTGVQDTPADPCTQEGDDRDDPQCLDGSGCETDGDCGMFNGPCNKNIGKQDHEWCNTTVHNGLVDDGSPHDTVCTSNCVRCISGPCSEAGDYAQLGFDPHEHAAMSYYGAKCRGPFVINGFRTEAFSPDSLAKIGACGTNFSQLDKDDVCQGLGGDSDSDGICDHQDNCPQEANTNQKNSDGDQEGGDICDLCPLYPLPTGDIDQDGIGDACDPDIDGDDCPNDVDQHPYEGNPIVGSVTLIGCGNDGGPLREPESSHSDFDGVPDCMDLDDDDDGICDEGGPHPPDPAQGIAEGCEEGPDPCPVHDPDICDFIKPGDPCPPIWPDCIGSGCVELFIRIYELINPDPTERTFDQVQILGPTLYASALPGVTASQSALALAGVANLGGARGSEAIEGERFYRMELWSRRTNELVDVLVERFTPDQVVFGQLARGGTIAITPTPDEGATALRIDVRWAPGAREDFLPADSDEDGRPDGHDNCSMHANPLQQDTDRDGIGDGCDPDFDNDGEVTEIDLELINTCIGVETAVEAPLSEPDDDELNGFQQPQPTPELLRESLRCAGTDLTGDGRVDDRDLVIALGYEGQPPGPSGGFSPGVTAESPGSLEGPLLLDKLQGRLLLDWGPRCHDEQDTAVYGGALGQPGSHLPLFCTDPGLDGKEILPLTPEARYYLAVPIRGEVEGSYGKDGDGFQRLRGYDVCAPMWIPDDRCPL